MDAALNLACFWCMWSYQRLKRRLKRRAFFSPRELYFFIAQGFSPSLNSA